MNKVNVETNPASKASVVKRIVMFLPFYLILKPLIKRNYWLRFESKMNGDNKHPDEWYWADGLAIKYGYYIK